MQCGKVLFPESDGVRTFSAENFRRFRPDFKGFRKFDGPVGKQNFFKALPVNVSQRCFSVRIEAAGDYGAV